MRVLILAGDVDGNLGDRAILTATCDLLREAAPDVAITVVARDPARAERELDVAAVPAGPRGLPALWRRAAGSDLVLVGGGGLFQDDDSLVKMPHWAVQSLSMRLLAPRVVAFALGVGPLSHGSSRLAARLAFRCMSQVTVRDPLAREVASRLARAPVTVLPDPALALRPATRDAARAALARAGVPLGERPLLGVALRRWFPPKPRLVPHRLARRIGMPDPQEGPDGRRLTLLLAEVLDRRIELGFGVVFLPTYCAASERDDALALAVRARMRRPSDTHLVRLADPRLYKACTGELAGFLAGRMHPLMLAASMGTPVVGLAYNPKFHGLAQMIGIEDRILDVTGFVRDGLGGELDAQLDRALNGPRFPGRRVHALVEDLRQGVRSLVRAVPQAESEGESARPW